MDENHNEPPNNQNAFVMKLETEENILRHKNVAGKIRNVGFPYDSQQEVLKQIPIYGEPYNADPRLNDESRELINKFHHYASATDFVAFSIEELRTLLIMVFIWINWTIKNHSLQGRMMIGEFLSFLKKNQIRNQNGVVCRGKYKQGLQNYLGLNDSEIQELYKLIDDVNRTRNLIIHCSYTENFNQVEVDEDGSETSERLIFLGKIEKILYIIQSRNPTVNYLSSDIIY